MKTVLVLKVDTPLFVPNLKTLTIPNFLNLSYILLTLTAFVNLFTDYNFSSTVFLKRSGHPITPYKISIWL